MLAKKPTLRSEIRNPETAEQQYQDSVMENFGRRGCTPIETARAIQKMTFIHFGEHPAYGAKVMEKLATIFVQSTAWVQQYRSLLKLHPDVQAMMEPSVPEALRLKFQIAYSLSNYPHEIQIKLAEQIIRKGFTFKQSLAYIRSQTSVEMRVNQQGRHRPSQKFDILNRFLKNLGEQAEVLLGMPHSTFVEMFEHRSPKDLEVLVKVLQRRISQLGELEEVLLSIPNGRKEEYGGKNVAEWPRRG